MRPDQVSGWELIGVQIVALAATVTLLWAAGRAFERSRMARRLVLVLAPVTGGVVAAGVLNTSEAIVSSYLFATVLFALGTVAMSILLLAAIPQTRGAALGALVAGGLLFIAFTLTYYALFTFGRPLWLQPHG